MFKLHGQTHTVYENDRGRRILYKKTAEARKTELSETPERISLKKSAAAYIYGRVT